MSIKSFFAFVAKFSTGKSRTIIIASFICSVLCASTLGNLSIDSDVLNLLPDNNEFTKAFRETYEDFGSFDQVILAVTIPQKENWRNYTSFIEDLAYNLSNKPTIKSVEYRIPDLFSFFNTIMEKSLLFLTPREFELFKEKIRDDKIKKQIKKNRILLVSSPSLKVEKKIELDPLDFYSIFSKRFKEKEDYIKIDVSKGYLLSNDHKAFAVLIKPEKNPQDIKFDKLFASDLDDAIKISLENMTDKFKNPDISYFGGHIIALEESNAIKADLIKNILTSALGITIFFFICFRNLLTIIIIFYPLLVSILVTFGFMNLFGVSLSASTSAFTAILIGLGVDFCIVMYNRFLFERKKGKSNSESCEIMLQTVGKSVSIGALTTAFCFYTLIFTQFKGLSQLGFLTGTGILITLVSTFFILPALLTTIDKFCSLKAPLTLFIESISAISMKFPKSTLTIGTIITITLLFGIFKVSFDEDFMKLRAGRINIETARKKIQDKFMNTSNHMSIIVEGKENVLDVNQKLYDLLAKMKAENKIGGVDSIQFYLNSTKGQKEILKKLWNKESDDIDFNRIETTFYKAIDENKFHRETFTPFLANLKKAISLKKPITIGDLEPEKFGNLFAKYIREKDGIYKVATYVYPKPDQWISSVPEWFIDDVKGIDKNVKITGINLASMATKKIIKSDASLASILALISVIILLLLTIRNITSIVIVLIPLIFGLVWMFGSYSILGFQVNLINIFAIAMVLGIGVDYGLHMFLRFKEDSKLVKENIISQAKGVTIASLTTIIGFSSIAFSSNPGIAYLGILATFGIISTWLIAMTILPAIFALMSE